MTATQIDFKGFCSWEVTKAGFLVQTASDLGMELNDSMVEIGVNPTSGNTYLFSENYSFSLYMPISCELKKEDIWIVYSDFRDGEEFEVSLAGFRSVEQIEEAIEAGEWRDWEPV